MAALCLWILAVFSPGITAAALTPTTLLRQDVDIFKSDAVRLPNAELLDGKMLADVSSIGGVRNFEMHDLTVKIVRQGLPGTSRKIQILSNYFEMRSNECWFLSGKWIDEKEGGLKESLGILGVNTVTLELTGQYDPWASDSSAPPGTSSPVGGGERTLTNSTPWKLAFNDPPGLVLAPGGTARGAGNFELAEDGQAFRIVYSPWRDVWEIQVMPNARPRIEVSWPGAPGGGGRWTAILSDEAIRNGNRWDKEAWVREYLKTKCRFDPSEYENWRLNWEEAFDTAVWTTNRCTVQWTKKGEAQALVENTGEVPLKWGKLAIPAGESLAVPWKEMGQLRREGLQVEPLGRGKTQASYVFETNWPAEEDESLGAINRVEIQARLKGPPLVRLENRSRVELRFEEVSIPAGRTTGISLDDGVAGTLVGWSLVVVPSAAQRALQDWPGTVEVSFTCPEYGVATNVAVDVTPTDKDPVKLVVTNPGPHDVFATVRGEVLTLKNRERKEWTIPWAEAREKAQTVSWTPVGRYAGDYREGLRKVTFGSAGTTETVECVLARKEMSVTVTNSGKIPLRVKFSDKEQEVAAGGSMNWTNVSPGGSGQALTYTIQGQGDWTNLWKGGETTWSGNETNVTIEARLNEEKLKNAVDEISEGFTELPEEFQGVNELGLDYVIFDNALKKLQGCGLSITNGWPITITNTLPDWTKFKERVEEWNKPDFLDKEWELLRSYNSWDAFMAQ